MSNTRMGLRTIFEEAVRKQTPDELNRYLDSACDGDSSLRAEVEALLESHQGAGQFLGGPVSEVSTTTDTGTEQLGEQVGPYKLLQVLGEGGFGVVYMAEQKEPVARRVALKVIKPGMDSGQVIARFEAERQALAMMDHPGIAKVFDAGTTSNGRPYFVMELVKGVPITQYCDEQHLTLRERLRLFVEVCHAVQHAHQKGVIHRDLKPPNILVADYDNRPTPKVIDFGIAKATHQSLTEKTVFTQFGQIVGTLEYMSPEQAKLSQLDIDTRSDIYSLGVLLYQLLTGVTPFEAKRLRSAAFDEMLRIIREEEPPKPSTRISTLGDAAAALSASRRTSAQKIRRFVKGDLDWVVMKSLEKDRARRYETANGFALDIERYLGEEPVTARPPSATYRLSKFIRRNKGILATSALVLLLLGLSSFAVQRFAHQETASQLTKQLLDATGEDVRLPLSRIQDYFPWAKVQLEEVAVKQHRIDDEERILNARLALVQGRESDYVGFLVEAMLTKQPTYVAVIRDVLKPYRDDVSEKLWSTLQGGNGDAAARYRAGIALAAYEPKSTKWRDDDYRFMAKYLLDEKPADQARWMSLQSNLVPQCFKIWQEIMEGDDLIEQVTLAHVLEYYLRSQELEPGQVATELVKAGPEQFGILFPWVKDSLSVRAPDELHRIAKVQATEAPGLDLKGRVDFGKQRAAASITLLRSGHLREALSGLDFTEDPESVAQFIHYCPEFGVSAERLLDCLDIVVAETSDAKKQGERIYALLLTLSGCELGGVPRSRLAKLEETLADWHRNDPRGIVHGATRWLLTEKFGLAGHEVVRSVEEAEIPYSPDREWFTKSVKLSDTGLTSHYTFVVVQPNEYTIGAAPYDPWQGKVETPHQTRITRPFAIADREVSVEEINAFSEATGRGVLSWVPDDPDSAGPGFNWYDSVYFCRWLTELAGLPPEQQAYSAPGSAALANLELESTGETETPRNWPIDVSRRGFRLPLEAEWEVACRAGVRTRYYFGNDESLLENYAWLGTNSLRKPHLPKTRKPNLRGMFDTHGNMFEWCHDWRTPYPDGPVRSDWTGGATGVRRVLRGGCWGIVPEFCRTSVRMGHHPSVAWPFIGLRIAMTLPSETELSRRQHDAADRAL